jgi:hypothetical protein
MMEELIDNSTRETTKRAEDAINKALQDLNW